MNKKDINLVHLLFVHLMMYEYIFQNISSHILTYLYLQLFKEGVLTGTQMALLKSKYIDLQNALTQ